MIDLKLSQFKPAVWLPNGHVQTIYASALMSVPIPVYRRELIELPDGDVVAADWVDGDSEQPLLVLVHGMEGDSRSRYARLIMNQCKQLGWRGVVLHMRSCGGVINRLRQFYHAGFYQDIEYFLDVVLPDRGIEGDTYLAGISLGGSQVTHYLAKGQAGKNITAAALVSAPMDLQASADFMVAGLNRLYVLKFRNSLLKKYHLKANLIKDPGLAEKLATAKTFWDLDNYATAPLHGFQNASQYYKKMSAKNALQDITVPTLYLASKDDPFIPEDSMPNMDDGLGHVRSLLTDRGGHVGFVDHRGRSWMVSTIFRYFSSFKSLQSQENTGFAKHN